MKIKNIFFLISLIIFSSNFCFAMESLQYSEHDFGQQNCEEIKLFVNGIFYIQQASELENENLQIFATPDALGDIEIILEAGKLSVKCPNANKNNFFGILKIKKVKKIFLAQDKDWFFFNKDA